MLMPKRVKWRKQQRGRMTGKATRAQKSPLVNLACRRWSRAGFPPARSKLLAARSCVK